MNENVNFAIWAVRNIISSLNIDNTHMSHRDVVKDVNIANGISDTAKSKNYKLDKVKFYV